MKKILVSLFATSIAVCSASAAKAQLVGTSTHTGDIETACSIVGTNGTLAGVGTVPTSIDSSAALGKFTTICNTTHGMTIKLLNTGTKPTMPSGANYVEKFRLLNAPTGYTALNTSAYSASDVTAAANSLPVTSATGYDVNVAAQGSVATGFLLPKGKYIIHVQATVSP